MLTNLFPNLALDGYTETSLTSTQYNCIAWAVGDDNRRWDPCTLLGSSYWPDGVPREQTIAAFVQVFEQLGYEECVSDALEHEFEKIAVYAHLDKGQHVARQLDNGLWTSKLGDLEDITHRLRGYLLMTRTSSALIVTFSSLGAPPPTGTIFIVYVPGFRSRVWPLVCNSFVLA